MAGKVRLKLVYGLNKLFFIHPLLLGIEFEDIIRIIFMRNQLGTLDIFRYFTSYIATSSILICPLLYKNTFSRPSLEEVQRMYFAAGASTRDGGPVLIQTNFNF